MNNMITCCTITYEFTNNHHDVEQGMSVAVKIDAVNDQQAHLLFGRHFDHTHRQERDGDFFIANLLVRIHLIIEMILVETDHPFLGPP